MNRDFIYLATDAAIASNRPSGGYHAMPCPASPGLNLVAIQHWLTVQEQDAWEALPGVTSLHIEDRGQQAPPILWQAFASKGASGGDTQRDVLTLARRLWPVFRI